MAALKINRRDAIGLLSLLWDFTGQYASAGDIGKFTDAAIAESVDWQTDRPDELVRHLVETHWLDRTADERVRLVVHDWHEHCEEWVRKKNTRAGITFVKAVLQPKNATDQDLSRQSVETKRLDKTAGQNGSPSLAQPSLPQPLLTLTPQDTKTAAPKTTTPPDKDGDSSRFEEIKTAWNSATGAVPIRKLTTARKTSLGARLKDSDWDWAQALAKFPLKCFEDEQGWKPDFDWFTRPDTVTKILEGKYDWSKNSSTRYPAPRPGQIGAPPGKYDGIGI